MPKITPRTSSPRGRISSQTRTSQRKGRFTQQTKRTTVKARKLKKKTNIVGGFYEW